MSKQSVDVVRTVSDLRRLTRAWRAQIERITLVPTMGALHEGHLSLIEAALAMGQRTIVSIFVNPTQFAPDEDLKTYPRDEENDLHKLAQLGVDAVWAPGPAQMYAEGFATTVVPKGAADGLETEFRPHFFAGVATVVAKLFNQVTPDVAVFGDKDYQQLCVVRQLVRDLDMPVEVIGCPTIRETDGLALSSRNAYLNARERGIAPALYRAIVDASKAVRDGDGAADVEARARTAIKEAGFQKVDYVAVREAETLATYRAKSDQSGRVLAAAWLGTTRLIDNVGF